jgi:hypothetical protein
MLYPGPYPLILSFSSSRIIFFPPFYSIFRIGPPPFLRSFPPPQDHLFSFCPTLVPASTSFPVLIFPQGHLQSSCPTPTVGGVPFLFFSYSPWISSIPPVLLSPEAHHLSSCPALNPTPYPFPYFTLTTGPPPFLLFHSLPSITSFPSVQPLPKPYSYWALSYNPTGRLSFPKS